MEKIPIIIYIILLLGCYNSIEDSADKTENLLPDNISDYTLTTLNATENTKIAYDYLLNLKSSYLFGQANA